MDYRRSAMLLLVIGCWQLCSVAPAWGQINTADGGSITTKSTGNDMLTVHYFCERSSSSSVGQFHIQVDSNVGPSTRERKLEVFLYKQGIRNATHSNVAYRIPITLVEGRQGVAVTIPIYLAEEFDERTSQSALFTWDVGVFEDGHDIEASRTIEGSAAKNAARPVNQNLRPFRSPPSQHHIALNRSKEPAVLRLVDDSTAPASVQPEMFRLFAAKTNNAGTAQSLTALVREDYGILSDMACVCNVRKLSSAPTQWQAYLQYDLIVLNGQSMHTLLSHHEQVANALKTYMSSGGRMILIDNDSTHPSRQQATSWLVDPVQSLKPLASKDGAWHGVHHPLADWWSRDFQWIYLTSQGSDGRRRSQTSYSSAYSPTGFSPSSGPGFQQPVPTPNSEEAQRQYVAQMEQSLRRSLSVKHDKPPELSYAGCIRDLLIAAKTYQVAAFSSELGMLQELGSFIQNGPDTTTMASLGMGGPFTPTQAPAANPALNLAVDSALDSSLYSSSNLATDNATRLLEILATLQDWVASGWQQIENQAVAFEYDRTENCIVRSFGLGKVAIIQGSMDSVPVDQLALLCIDLNRSVASGVDAANDRNWYWRNFIDSVGKPPVWAFCAIVLLFGILIGPGLLLLTAWIGRRSLLILLVPSLSLVATLLIVAYEVLHEGFETTIRVNSVLAIDEITGQGFAWSRQTYFSGWPSEEGLVFPQDVFFRPVEFSFRDGENMEAPRRSGRSQIEVAETQTRWVGWLRAREQQQMLVGHPVKAKAPIKVTPLGKNRLSIKNLTAEQLPIVVVRDGGDGYYVAENLDVGAEVECTGVMDSDVGTLLARYRVDRIATMPDGMRTTSLGRNRAVRTVDNESSSSPEVLDSIWSDYFSDKLNLPDYGFSTIMRNCDAVHLPTSGRVTETSSLVVGRLSW